MELNVAINEESVVNVVVKKLMASPEFWDLLRNKLADDLYAKATLEFEEKKDQILTRASAELVSTVDFKVQNIERDLSTLASAKMNETRERIVKAGNSAVNTIIAELDQKKVDYTLVGIIKEMYGQKLGSLIAKSVEKMAKSLNQGEG